MIIKAKYPQVGNEYGGANAKAQGFGSLYGGNHASTVTQLPRSEEINENHASDWV